MVYFILENTPEALQQLTSLHKVHSLEGGNSEITFSQDLAVDVNNVNNNKRFPKIHHFYIELVDGNDFAVEIKGEKDKMIYHNSTGSLLNTLTKTANPIVSLKKGDVLGFVTAFFYEYNFGKRSRYTGYYSISQFLINGKATGQGIRMDGETSTLIMYRNSKNTQIQTSIAPHQLNTLLGNVCKDNLFDAYVN